MPSNGHSVELAGVDLGGQRHICAFFYSTDEEHRVLRSFYKDGFDRGQKATHIVEAENRAEYLKRLAEAGINVEKLIQSGADAGYALTRLVGHHMDWLFLDKPAVNNLVEYEARLNHLLSKYNDPVICNYDLSKFGATVAMDIMRTHQLVVIGGLLRENPFFVPPDQFLHQMRERR